MVIQTGLNGLEKTLAECDRKLFKLGFAREAWDYHGGHYDYKIERNEEVYYLRLKVKAIEGVLEKPEAILKFEEPYIGRHYYPHGVDYETPPPSDVMKQAKDILAQVKGSIS